MRLGNFAPTIAKSAPGSPLLAGKDQLYQKTAPPAKVSLIKGNDRRENILAALKKIEDQVLASIGDKQVLIKPNFVSTNRQLAATHVDEVRAILDFLTPSCKKQILIGESTAGKNTFDGYKNYGYLALESEYNAKLIDLNQQTWQYCYVVGPGNRPTPIRIISTFFDPNMYIISAAQMKTHDRLPATLSLKNIFLGAPLNDYKRSDKGMMHQVASFTREAVLNYNMFHLAQQIFPNLGVIDGFEAMEGNGPIGGTPVEAKVALASTDAVALDTLATKLMGFDPTEVSYLSAMAQAGMGQGDLTKVEVLGTPVEQCQFKFKLHDKLQGVYTSGA